MSSCPRCGTPTPDGKNFCPKCYGQVKCIGCESVLDPEAPICLVCGTPIKATAQSTDAVSTYSFDETVTKGTTERRIRLTATDRAVESGADLFRGLGLHSLGLPMTSGGQAPPRVQTVSSSPPNRLLTEPPIQDAEVVLDDVDHSGGTANPDVQAETPKTNEASKYFHVDGEFLVADEVDYKGDLKKTQQQRFALLYIWAYKVLTDNAVPSRGHLNKAAKNHNLHDKNFSSYLGQVLGTFTNTTEEGISINSGGTLKIKEVLKYIEDNSDKTGFKYWEQSHSPSSGGPKTHKLNKDEKALASEWIKTPSNLSNYNTRKIDSSWKWAAFTLYDLTIAMKVTDSVRPGTAYLYLTERYGSVSVKKPVFGDALSQDKNGRFGKTAEGKYFLTTKGENEIKQLLESNLDNTGTEQ